MDLLRRVRRRRRRPGRDRPAHRSSAWIYDEPLPPACPPGFVTGPPDFVGVGAQKAGTTWWFRLIAAHPDVHQDEHQRPELHFFDRYHTTWPGRADIERYHRLFPRPLGALAGEKTPEYMSDPWVPRMLHEAAPDTRLIVLLRDPIERYRSALTHGSLRDWPQERRTTLDAFHKGVYGPQLERLSAWFDPSQMLILQYERCAIDPAGQISRTLRFLGLADHTFSEEELRRPRNETRVEKVALPPERLESLRELYEPDVRALPGTVADLDVSLWPNFAHLAA